MVLGRQLRRFWSCRSSWTYGPPTVPLWPTALGTSLSSLTRPFLGADSQWLEQQMVGEFLFRNLLSGHRYLLFLRKNR